MKTNIPTGRQRTAPYATRNQATTPKRVALQTGTLTIRAMTPGDPLAVNAVDRPMRPWRARTGVKIAHTATAPGELAKRYAAVLLAGPQPTPEKPRLIPVYPAGKTGHAHEFRAHLASRLAYNCAASYPDTKERLAAELRAQYHGWIFTEVSPGDFL